MNTSINSITELLNEKTINELKQIDFFQEDKREIYYLNSYNKTITKKFNKSIFIINA